MNSGIIFDVDGVLVDSGDAHFKSWQRLAERVQAPPITREKFAASFGQRSEAIIREWFSIADPSEIHRLDEEKEGFFREIISAEFPAMPGAAELIRTLHGAGMKIALGSSGPPENVSLVIERLGISAQLSAVVTGRDVQRGKPDPQVFQLAARKLAIAPRRCVVVEDAPVGIESARRGGMPCIALAGTHARENLGAADLVVDSLGAITPQVVTALVSKS